jgi:RNA recognition motif-containing protein
MEKDASDTVACLFIGGMTSTTTVDDLRNYFSQFKVSIRGIELKKTKLKREKTVKVGRGFGYLKLDSKDEAEMLLMYSHELNDRAIDIEYAYPKGLKNKYTNLDRLKRVHISNLAESVTDEQLTKYFRNFGKIKKAYKIRDFKTGTFKNYGFVLFEDKSIAQKVINLSKAGELILEYFPITAELYMPKGRVFHENKAHGIEHQEDPAEGIKQEGSVNQNDKKEKKMLKFASQPSAGNHHRGSMYGVSHDGEVVPQIFDPQTFTEGKGAHKKGLAFKSVFYRQNLTESRASSIYLADRFSIGSRLSRSPKKTINDIGQSSSLRTIIMRDENKPVIDAVIRAGKEQPLDHQDDNIMFRIYKPSSRRVREIPTLRSEDSRKLKGNQGLKMPSSRTPKSFVQEDCFSGMESSFSRHSFVDPLTGKPRFSKRFPSREGSHDPSRG